MAIIVEDGTGTNADANSYADVALLDSYISLRRITLPDDEPLKRSLLIKAMDYLEAQGGRYKGVKASGTQPLQWPRKDAWDIDFPGALYPSNSIPRELEAAQLALAVEAYTHDLQPTQLPSDSGPVVKERVEGALEVVYDNPQGGNLHTPYFAKPAALLANLYRNNGLSLVRNTKNSIRR